MEGSLAWPGGACVGPFDTGWTPLSPGRWRRIIDTFPVQPGETANAAADGPDDADAADDLLADPACGAPQCGHRDRLAAGGGRPAPHHLGGHRGARAPAGAGAGA